MAGTIPLSLTQQFDKDTLRPLSGGKLYLFEAGTTTPQDPFSDSALTIELPNPITLDAAGRIPQFFLADGQVKIRLTSANGVTQIAADNVLVIGPSSGEGGGGTVDATTVLTTGDIKTRYGTGTLTGFVRANARTIGSASSGATERANADTQALFEYLWNSDANLTVSTGRGASAAADWAANKTIALPDARGRILASLDDMGNSAAGRLTATYLGVVGTTLGLAGGSQSSTLSLTHLPPVPVIGPVSIVDLGHVHQGTITDVGTGNTFGTNASAGAGSTVPTANNTGSVYRTASASTGITASVNITAGGSSTAFSNLPPMLLVTTYIKL